MHAHIKKIDYQFIKNYLYRFIIRIKNKRKEAADAASFETVVSESHIAMSDTRVKFLWLVVLLSCSAF